VLCGWVVEIDIANPEESDAKIESLLLATSEFVCAEKVLRRMDGEVSDRELLGMTVEADRGPTDEVGDAISCG